MTQERLSGFEQAMRFVGGGEQRDGVMNCRVGEELLVQRLMRGPYPRLHFVVYDATIPVCFLYVLLPCESIVSSFYFYVWC